MKKTFTINLFQGIFSAFVLGMMLTLTGCSNESLPEPQEDQYVFESQTIRELSEFNRSLEDMTRSDQSLDLKEILKVPLTDAKGAYEGAKLGLKTAELISNGSAEAGLNVGGAVVGSAASYDIYRMTTINTSTNSDFELESMENSEQNSLSSSFDTGIDGIYFAAAYGYSKQYVKDSDYELGSSIGVESRDCIWVGILHNHILSYISILLAGYDPKPWFLILSPDEKAIYNSNYFNEGWNKLRTHGFPNQQITTEPDRIMNMYIEAVSTYGINKSEIIQITKQYVSTIKNSTSLSLNDKKTLWCGFCVMAYSYNFWQNKLNLK